MIRALAFLLAGLVGMTAALTTQGRVYHLRLVLHEKMPAWSDQLANESGLTQGTMRLSGISEAAPLNVSWRALAPDLNGLHWELRLTGPGTDVRTRMRMPFNLSKAVFDTAEGTVDLSGLGNAALDLGGIIQLTGLNLTLEGIHKTPYASGSAEAQWLGARFQGADIGKGPIRVELDPLLSWRAWVDLQGGVADIHTEITGRLPRLKASLEFRISDDPALPKRWRRALSLTGEKEQDVWLVRETVTLHP